MRFFSVFICMTGLLFAGCSVSRPETSAVTKLQPGVVISEPELAKTGEAFFRQAVSALESGDYEKFTEHYVPEYKQRITKDIFEQMAISFRNRHGKLKRFRYLGTVNKYAGRILLWSAIFERTPAVNEQLKKSGINPADVPDTESLVQIMLGKTAQGWKIIRMGVQ